jgi:hypothetical protein
MRCKPAEHNARYYVTPAELASNIDTSNSNRMNNEQKPFVEGSGKRYYKFAGVIALGG